MVGTGLNIRVQFHSATAIRNPSRETESGRSDPWGGTTGAAPRKRGRVEGDAGGGREKRTDKQEG